MNAIDYIRQYGPITHAAECPAAAIYTIDRGPCNCGRDDARAILAADEAKNRPAVYDPETKTLTCPCGFAGHVSEFTLIETGYCRTWDLEELEDTSGDPYVNASDDSFSEDGDAVVRLAHYSKGPDGGECDIEAIAPENFEFEWNGGC
jgi:hypothetical protein